MQTLYDLTVFQKTYDLYVLLHTLIKKFPKHDQYTLGEQCKNTTLLMLESIIMAGNAKREWKIPPLDTALTKLELLKIFLRLACETACISQKQYTDTQTRLQEIGRMLGGWKKSI